jgi:hypothetical protein
LKHAQLAVSVARTFENGAEAVAFLDELLPGLTAAPKPVEEKKKDEKEKKVEKKTEEKEEKPLPAPPTAAAAQPKLDPDSRQPFVLLTMERAHFQLLLGQSEETKEAMERCEKILEGLDSVDGSVNAAFWRVSGDYWKVCFLLFPTSSRSPAAVLKRKTAY